MASNKIFSIGIVLCCVILIQFMLIIGLAYQNQKVVIEEVEVIKEIEVIKEVPFLVKVEVEPTYAYDVTSEEREMLARLVFLEANIENLECQKAVASVVINRWQDGRWGDSIEDVIYAEGQFTPAHKIYKTTPNETNYEAVDYVLRYGCTLPSYCLYFRADYHFNWKGYMPYTKIDKTCFGYMAKDK